MKHTHESETNNESEEVPVQLKFLLGALILGITAVAARLMGFF